MSDTKNEPAPTQEAEPEAVERTVEERVSALENMVTEIHSHIIPKGEPVTEQEEGEEEEVEDEVVEEAAPAEMSDADKDDIADRVAKRLAKTAAHKPAKPGSSPSVVKRDVNKNVDLLDEDRFMKRANLRHGEDPRYKRS